MAEPRIPEEMLGNYAHILAEVATTGRRLTRNELEMRRALGREAADAGHQLRALVTMHLAQTREAWPRAAAGNSPATVDAVLAAVEQAVDAFAEGFERAQRLTVRREEAARREFIDDLLYGRSDLVRLAERATRFGLRLSRAHAATDGRARSVHGARTRCPGGVVHSYDEALEALDLAERMGMEDPVLYASDLLVYPVLTRDRQAMADLVRSELGPLQKARGGAEPLLKTLAVYFDAGCVAAETARRLALSVRALTYRLERIHQLTGSDPADPMHRYSLQTAVIGARLLDWPAKEL
ncbi:PucR family transcriptional regulator [Streptomyces sp. S6]|nr:PucR family transcriptional regulator [Streptomyces sp. S6]